MTDQPLTDRPSTDQPPTDKPQLAHTHEMPGELAALLRQVVPGGGRFGHREHVYLTFLTVRANGTGVATTKIARWIRHIAVYERAPQKYNATMTRAWTEIVGHHVDADPAVADFGEFADRHPALLDKRLLRGHYSSALLASTTARREWVAPDLTPFPWY